MRAMSPPAPPPLPCHIMPPLPPLRRSAAPPHSELLPLQHPSCNCSSRGSSSGCMGVSVCSLQVQYPCSRGSSSCSSGSSSILHLFCRDVPPHASLSTSFFHRGRVLTQLVLIPTTVHADMSAKTCQTQKCLPFGPFFRHKKTSRRRHIGRHVRLINLKHDIDFLAGGC